MAPRVFIECARRAMRAVCSLLLMSAVCFAQPQAGNAEGKDLLERLAGDWVLNGTIAKKKTTHDVKAEWVLNHEYLRLHEVSREKNPGGGPAYEAIVFISWDEKTQQYTCLWLDSTAGGGLSAEGLGHAKRAGSSIPFIIGTTPDDLIHTTFTYDSSSDAWTLIIDNVTKGKANRFATLNLFRSK